MTIQIRRTGPRHSVVTLSQRSFPKKALDFMDKYLLCCDPTNAVIAKDGDRIVGFFRYHRDERGLLMAHGTWVERAYRGRGIASRLWRHALRCEGALTVEVTTVSKPGAKLVQKVRRTHRKVQVLWEDYSQRSV